MSTGGAQGGRLRYRGPERRPQASPMRPVGARLGRPRAPRGASKSELTRRRTRRAREAQEECGGAEVPRRSVALGGEVDRPGRQASFAEHNLRVQRRENSLLPGSLAHEKSLEVEAGRTADADHE